MSRRVLSKLSPQTHRVIAAAFMHERKYGRPMTPGVIRRICESEGASFGACLAIILGKGLNSPTGKLVPLGTPGSSIVVPDDESVVAFDWREEIDPD